MYLIQDTGYDGLTELNLSNNSTLAMQSAKTAFAE